LKYKDQIVINKTSFPNGKTTPPESVTCIFPQGEGVCQASSTPHMGLVSWSSNRVREWTWPISKSANNHICNTQIITNLFITFQKNVQIWLGTRELKLTRAHEMVFLFPQNEVALIPSYHWDHHL